MVHGVAEHLFERNAHVGEALDDAVGGQEDAAEDVAGEDALDLAPVGHAVDHQQVQRDEFDELAAVLKHGDGPVAALDAGVHRNDDGGGVDEKGLEREFLGGPFEAKEEQTRFLGEEQQYEHLGEANGHARDLDLQYPERTDGEGDEVQAALGVLQNEEKAGQADSGNRPEQNSPRRQPGDQDHANGRHADERAGQSNE